MKTISENQNNNLVAFTNLDNTVVNLDNAVMKAPTHVLVTNIELKNGKVAPIITMFNNSEIDFEEVKIGVDMTITRNHLLQNKMSSKQATLYRLVDGNLKRSASYLKTYFE